MLLDSLGAEPPHATAETLKGTKPSTAPQHVLLPSNKDGSDDGSNDGLNMQHHWLDKNPRKYTW
jgi:hypothetical protein